MSAPVPGADQRALAQMANQLAEQQREIELIKMGQNTAALGFSSIENGSLVIYDADGNVRNVIGKQDDGSYVGGASPVALDPPEIPKPPIVTPGFGVLKVASQGSTDPPWPRSFSHLNVYLSKGTGEEGDPLGPGVVVGTIIGTTDSAFVIANLEPGETYRVWLTSVGIDTAESDASTAVTAVPTYVVGPDILEGAITELQLADDAVTEAKLAANSVGSIQIQGEVIDVTKLADGSVDGDKIVANAIGVGHLAAASVTSLAIAATAIQADHIAAGAIQAGHLAADSVTAANILALQIQADHLAANAVTAGKIDAGAIRADHLQAGIIIADATMETGTSGRRVVISGPANEIRFFPQLNEFAYGRLFSYVSDIYPEDVNIELRAIDSDEVNVQPRLILTPDSVVAAITNRGDETQLAGGRMQLEESVATLQIKGDDDTNRGLYIYSDSGLILKGYFDNYRTPSPDDALFVMCTRVTNTGGSGTYIVGLTYHFNTTLNRPYGIIVSAGMVDYLNDRAWNIRSANPGTDSFIILIGFSTQAGGASTAIPGGMSIDITALMICLDQQLTQDIVGTPNG